MRPHFTPPSRIKHRILHADLVKEPPHLAEFAAKALDDEQVARQLAHLMHWRKGTPKASPDWPLIEVILRRYLWLLREGKRRRKAAKD